MTLDLKLRKKRKNLLTKNDTMRKHPLDKGSFWIIMAVAVLFVYTSVYDMRYLHLVFYKSSFFFYFGIFFIVLGFVLRFYCEGFLQKQFSVFVAIQPKHELMTKGPYAYVRHPIYSAAIMKALGFVLLTNSVLGLVAFLIILIPALLYRISLEEKALVGHFGQDYLRYKKRVKALIPWVI